MHMALKKMYNFKCISIIFVIGACSQSVVHSAGYTKTIRKPLWNSTNTDRLRQDLLLNYDKFSRPAQHYNQTPVSFTMAIRYIELNEFKSTLTVSCFLYLKWEDEKLKWNASDYGDLELLHLAEHEIWQPDIYLYNSAVSRSINQYSNTYFKIHSNGIIDWNPPAQFTVLCALNLKYWPFDTQECYMKFVSWSYSGDQIDVLLYENRTKPVLDLLNDNTEWFVTKVTQERMIKSYPCCSEWYPEIIINIKLSRISPSYKTIIITPLFVIVTLILLNFWLPPTAGEKIILNASTTIIICLFMLYFTQKIPTMGVHTPLIVLFYSSSLYIVTFSMIGSIIVVTMARTKHTTALPRIIKQLLTGKTGTLLGLHSYILQSTTNSYRITAEEMRDHQVVEFDDHDGDDHHIIRPSTNVCKPSIQEDWILLAVAIDRISFIFYCLLFVILAIAYSV